MKDFDEQDDLWQLLGKAKKNAVSPLFARNVLREIRSSQNSRDGGIFSWLLLRWRVVSIGGLAAILLAVGAPRLFVLHNATPSVAIQAPQSSPSTEAAGNASKPDDIEVIRHLDELVAYEENSIWLEDSSN